MDVWFHYDKGHVTTIEEDTNRDGKPDLWEEYDESEAMTRRYRDLNFDGKPDIEDKREPQIGARKSHSVKEKKRL